MKQGDQHRGFVSTDDIKNRADYMRLFRAAERGDMIRVRRGVYAEPEAVVSTMVDVERIVPGGIVCLYNAWAYYGLTTTVAPAFCIAVEAKRKVVLPNIIPITLYYWKREYLEFGITTCEISGCTVRITDLERSVCDVVKYRNKVGIDLCAEVVRAYLRRPDRNLSLLADYAKRLRVSKILNNYLDFAME
jgi:predicted transcriptional regulator of viral defense system